MRCLDGMDPKRAHKPPSEMVRLDVSPGGPMGRNRIAEQVLASLCDWDVYSPMLAHEIGIKPSGVPATYALRAHRPGDRVSVTVLRGTEKVTHEVILEVREVIPVR